jgi:ABC-type Co2+ transport system permease subunit
MMISDSALSLLAVHISDGFLEPAWWVGGFLLASLLWYLSTRKITDREIPRIGVISAAFFVASQFHLPTGVGTVHLVLNGLAGVVLGIRAPLAITIGLFLQSLLFEHGGRTMLGLNTCLIAIPAVFAGVLFPVVRRSRLVEVVLLRKLLVGLLILVWVSLATFALQIAIIKFQRAELPGWPNYWINRGEIQAILILVAGIGSLLEFRLEKTPDFALGLLLGAGTVASTVVLKAGVIWLGGKGDWLALAAADLVAHTPVIVLEGIGCGFIVSLLARAKPEWLQGLYTGPG